MHLSCIKLSGFFLLGMISGPHTKKLIHNHIRNGIKILKQLRSSVLCRRLSVFKTEALFSKPRLQPRLWEVLGYRYEKCTHSFVLNLHCNYPCFVCFHGWEVIRNWKTSDSQNGITTEIWSKWPKLWERHQLWYKTWCGGNKHCRELGIWDFFPRPWRGKR